MAAAYLAAAGVLPAEPAAVVRDGPGAPDSRRWRLVSQLVQRGTWAPVTTSAGRLFDAVASLLGVAQESTYEAEAAMRLEAMASVCDLRSVAAIAVAQTGEPLVLDTVGLVAALVRERDRGRPADELAAVFHESLARAVATACVGLAARHGVGRVALSGGVFQNALLLERVEQLLRDRDLDVYSNEQVPANDGGVSLGQALVAASRGGGHHLP